MVKGALKPPDPERSIGFLLSDVTRLLRRDFMRRAQAMGLSQAQWQALAYLSRRQGVNQVTLADSLDVQPITLARLIDRLQAAGLVERRPDPNDRRAQRLYLTDAAAPLLERMWLLAAETRAMALGELPETRLEALIETLQQIKRNLLGADAHSAVSSGSAPETGQE